MRRKNQKSLAFVSAKENEMCLELLYNDKLGLIAALRNIRNIMSNPRKDTIDMWCNLITDVDKIHQSLILPCHFDLAYDVVMNEFKDVDYSPEVQKALRDGYEKSIPNLKDTLPGKTCIMVDCSGSMGSYSYSNGRNTTRCYWNRYDESNRMSCAYKAGLIAATIAKATEADVVKFGSEANMFDYNKNLNVFALAKEIGTAEYGCTRPNKAFELIKNNKLKYDRIIFISDNEVNSQNLTSKAYKEYIHDVCSPYIYAVDLAAYGTTPLGGNKVFYCYGYGNQMFDMIGSKEFDPKKHIDEVRKIVI